MASKIRFEDVIENGEKASAYHSYLEELGTAKPRGKRLMCPKIYHSSRNRLYRGLLLCSKVPKWKRNCVS